MSAQRFPDPENKGGRKRRVAIVAAHFPPSNLTSVHRARLWSEGLREQGWEPVIVTTHWRHYEEELDWDLLDLVPDDLDVRRTRALPTRPLRPIGDIGIRAFYWHYRELKRLAEEEGLDFVHITIPSFFSSLLGRLIFKACGIPYGVDYIDPWVLETEVRHRFLSKAWAADRLAERLEPWAVKEARLITGVAESYFEGVLKRNPHLRAQAVTAAMPYGSSNSDFEMLRRRPRAPFLFNPGDGCFHVLYAGAMLPQAYPVLESFFASISLLVKNSPTLAGRLRLHFVGTGKSPTDPRGYNLLPLIEKLGLRQWADEHPHRIRYVDVLNHLNLCSAVLIVGSTEPHYTPSKVFQAALSGRPIFAMLRRESSACDLIRRSGAGEVFDFGEGELPHPQLLAEAFERFAERTGGGRPPVKWDLFEEFTARRTAARLAAALDKAVKRNWNRRAPGGSNSSSPLPNP